MKLTKLIGSFIGGIAAIAGFGMMFTGCEEEDDLVAEYGPPFVNDADKCCRLELQFENNDLDYCMSQYEKINKCDRDKLSSAGYAVYGMPSVEQMTEYCCGKDKSHPGYDACRENYVQTYECSKPVPGSDKAIQNCCGEINSGSNYQRCVDDYKKNDFNCVSPNTPVGPALPIASISEKTAPVANQSQVQIKTSKHAAKHPKQTRITRPVSMIIKTAASNVLMHRTRISPSTECPPLRTWQRIAVARKMTHRNIRSA